MEAAAQKDPPSDVDQALASLRLAFLPRQSRLICIPTVFEHRWYSEVSKSTALTTAV
jgi:hypothetical protein